MSYTSNVLRFTQYCVSITFSNLTIIQVYVYMCACERACVRAYLFVCLFVCLSVCLFVLKSPIRQRNICTLTRYNDHKHFQIGVSWMNIECSMVLACAVCDSGKRPVGEIVNRESVLLCGD